MAFDIESIVKDLVSKISGNSSLIDSFKKDPAATLKRLGVNLESDQLQAVIKAVSAKLGIKNATGLLAKIKSLLGLGK